MAQNLHPDISIKVDFLDDSNDYGGSSSMLRRSSTASICSQNRPRSSPPVGKKENYLTLGVETSRPISLSVENVRNQRPLSFSVLMHDIESKANEKTALEERKLRELLNNMKQVKGNTLIVLVFETFLYHMCFYIADVITDIVNGHHHYNQSRLKKLLYNDKIIFDILEKKHQISCLHNHHYLF